MARATVDVSLRADVKQLIDGLAQVEGVTKKEARAMVREMRKGYNAQVKAAQLAALAFLVTLKAFSMRRAQARSDSAWVRRLRLPLSLVARLFRSWPCSSTPKRSAH